MLIKQIIQNGKDVFPGTRTKSAGLSVGKVAIHALCMEVGPNKSRVKTRKVGMQSPRRPKSTHAHLISIYVVPPINYPPTSGNII